MHVIEFLLVFNEKMIQMVQSGFTEKFLRCKTIEARRDRASCFVDLVQAMGWVSPGCWFREIWFCWKKANSVCILESKKEAFVK
jgi:hypothetical protein